METIDRALATADRTWRAYGVRRADRAALAADLRLDLEAAAADGISPEQLLDGDVTGFARRLADEAGVHREPAELGRLAGTSLLGAGLGAVAGGIWLNLLYPLAVQVFSDPLPWHPPLPVAIALYYGIPAAGVVAAAIITVRLRLRGVAQIRRTGRAMTALLPVAGLLITPVTMAFSWATGYSSQPPVVLTEVAMVAAALAGATVLARRWSLREPMESPELSARPSGSSA